ncbi:spore germination protein GerW family protein [Pengzhenrongella sp.]|jgi:uncharacterized spore protein YtfJ|uniref:spore germination protein GerW family protein n=1 Tax=Pengzhenrongella sp. TaxID=2888820 RepID=UPI002F92A85F
MSESTQSETTPTKPPFDPIAVTKAASDALSVRRVFGEAYEHNGVWVIPVAKMMGGTGSGFGTGAVGGSGEKDAHAEHHGPHGEGEGSGGGGGFGIKVRPVGVYVVDDSGVRWRPAIDVTRVILGAQAVGIVIAVSLSWVLRKRRK